MSELTPTVIKELKSFLVERIVDNMSTKNLVEYVTDDLDEYYDELTDSQFIIEAQNYWDDPMIFDEVVEEIKEYTNCEFKKPIEERRNAVWQLWTNNFRLRIKVLP